MELSLILLQQIIVMLSVLGVGVICFKKKLITDKSKQDLSSLLLMVVNPITILLSYQREFEEALFQNLMISFGLAVGTFLLVIGLSYLLIRPTSRRHIVERFSLCYSNCGYFGIPVISSVFGGEGVFYLSAYMAIFQLFAWTHGFLLMRGKTETQVPWNIMVRNFLSPAMLAPLIGLVLFLLQWTLPDIVTDAANSLSAMNTPLAMLIAGLTLAQSNLKKVFLSLRVYYMAFLKLILLPVVALLFLWPLGLDPMVSTVAVLVVGCPSAVLAVLFSVRFDQDAVYASEVFTATTILCAATLPIIFYACQLLLS